MKRNTLFTLALAAVLGVTLAAQKQQITGAGATFPYPIYSKWFSEYNKVNPNVEINYQSIGSGGGIRQVTNQTVFFGATDGPMTNDQLLAQTRAREFINFRRRGASDFVGAMESVLDAVFRRRLPLQATVAACRRPGGDEARLVVDLDRRYPLDPSVVVALLLHPMSRSYATRWLR